MLCRSFVQAAFADLPFESVEVTKIYVESLFIFWQEVRVRMCCCCRYWILWKSGLMWSAFLDIEAGHGGCAFRVIVVAVWDSFASRLQ